MHLCFQHRMTSQIYTVYSEPQKFIAFNFTHKDPQMDMSSHIKSVVTLKSHLNITIKEIIEELSHKVPCHWNEKGDLHYTSNVFTSEVIGLPPRDHPIRDVRRLPRIVDMNGK